MPKIWLILAAIAVLLVGGMAAVMAYSEVGLSYRLGADASPAASHVDDIPEAVSRMAEEQASRLFPDPTRRQDFAAQLLASYREARDKDLAVIFTSGGLGWTSLDESVQWQTMHAGMESVMAGLGYKTVWLVYERTSHHFLSFMHEIMANLTGYSSKSGNLAARVQFLLDSLPELRVMMAGESNGAGLVNRAMQQLQPNPRAYCLQTGPAFWHKKLPLERTLVLTHNGIQPDSFSRGDIWAMVKGTFRALFNKAQPLDDEGNVLYYVRAPGHDYRWRYPGVGTVITAFLKAEFPHKN